MILMRKNMLGCHSAEAVMIGARMDTDVISRNGKRYVYSAGPFWVLDEGYT